MTPAELSSFQRFDTLVKSFTENSTDLNKQALSVLGGSILLILSTNYIKPPVRKARLIYLLFIPAWTFLTFTLYFNNIIMRQNAAYFFSMNKEDKLGICSDINDVYANQLLAFQSSIVILAMWLTAYLIWWIFYSDNNLNPGK